MRAGGLVFGGSKSEGSKSKVLLSFAFVRESRPVAYVRELNNKVDSRRGHK
jgi:hypothetical protein